MKRNYKLIYKQKPADERNYVYISQTTQKTLNLTLPNPSNSIVCIKTNIPVSYSIPSKNLASILDQGTVGDCVCNAAAFAVSSITNTVKPSRLCMYALARILDDVDLSNDSGLNVIDAGTTIQKYGVCQETSWPYVEANFSVMPSLAALKSCNTFKSFSYYFVNQDLQSIKQALYTNKCPIVFGINVYDSFMSSHVASTGIVPMPNTTTETLQGGHCLALIGYDDTTQLFTFANSWGTTWGKNGYGYIPYAYLTDFNLSMDFCYYKINFTGFPVKLKLENENKNENKKLNISFNVKHHLSKMKFV